MQFLTALFTLIVITQTALNCSDAGDSSDSLIAPIARITQNALNYADAGDSADCLFALVVRISQTAYTTQVDVGGNFCLLDYTSCKDCTDCSELQGCWSNCLYES